MLSNYLLVAMRNMRRNPMSTVINIVGLGIGIATCLLVFLFVMYELDYDQHFADAERIYRIDNHYTIKNQTVEYRTAKLSAGEGTLLRSEMPGLDKVVRLYATPDKEVQIAYENKRFVESHVYFADPDVFDVFNFTFVAGNAATALQRPHSVVLTRSMADKLFAGQQAVGKTLTYRNNINFEVTAVIEDIPAQSHLAINLLVSINTLPQLEDPAVLESWLGTRAYTFVKLPPGMEATVAEQRISSLLDGHGGEVEANNNYHLLALSDIHLYGHNYNEMKPNGDIRNLYVYAAICFIMLIVVAINFINLSTARAMQRAKEVGVRKSIGAYRQQLITQFLSESTLLTLLASATGMLLAALLIPSVAGVFERQLETAMLLAPGTLGFMLLLTLTIGLLAGLYPAVFLSGFDAAAVLKGNITRGKTGAVFRQSLVCFQFVITVFLIICTAFMALQMHFVTKERVGYNTEHKIMVRIPYNRPDAFKPLKNELLKHPDILQVTGSSAIPTETVGDKRNFYRAEDRSNPVMLAYVGIEDPLFFEFYGLKVQHGRNFDASKTTDRLVQSAATDLPMAFIVNESAARELGMSPEQAEGRTVVMPLQENSRATGTVIGVTRDTNFDSFKNDTLPIVFYLDETENSRVSIMTTGKNTASVVEHIEKTWLSILPEEPPKLRFVDAMFNNIYKNEAQQVQLFLLLSTLSIFLSLLGLYGLTAFNAQRMSKEIAIRKVLGASLNRIITLLSKEVIRLALLANLIAWPLAYLTMSSWLSAFVYRIELSWWLFITASAGAFALAWLTLAIHAVFVERRPVVHSLKYE